MRYFFIGGPGCKMLVFKLTESNSLGENLIEGKLEAVKARLVYLNGKHLTVSEEV